MKGVVQNFWEKKKGLFSSFLWFSILEGYHAYLNHHSEPVPHHILILFVLDNAEGIETYCHYDFSHYVQRKLLFWWFKSGVFEPHFGTYSRCNRRYPYIKGCHSGASQKILWKQVVTCSAHSKKHFKTNLAEYWGEGVHGRSSYFPDYWHCGNGQSIALSERVFWRQNSSATHATLSALTQR